MPKVERLDTVTAEALAEELVRGLSDGQNSRLRRLALAIIRRHIGKRIEGSEQL